MFNFFGSDNKSRSRAKGGGFWASMWSAGAFAALTSFTFSMLSIVYLTRDAIETNDELIMRACLASPLFLLAGILCLGLMAKQAAKYFADGFHAANQQAPQLPMASHAETIDAVARLVVSQQTQVNEVYQAQLRQGGTTLLPAPTGHLMDALRDEECILVWGQKKAGKTTVLLHLIRDRLMRGHEVLIFDPHAAPNKWGGAKTVGGGRGYEAIENGLMGVVDEMTRRYDEINRGVVIEGAHPHLLVIVDEYRGIVINTKEAQECIKTLLTEARKTNIHIAVISHSKSVKALGFKGEGDLREGLAIVHILKDKQGRRWSEVSFNGDAAIEMILPGPFHHQSQYHTNTIPNNPVPSINLVSPDTSKKSSNTSSVPEQKTLSIEEVIEKLREKGKSEEVITKYLAKKYPKLSANAIQKMVKLGRNKVMAIVRAARNTDNSKQNGHHKNGRIV